MCIDAVVSAAADKSYSVTVLHHACATLNLTFRGVTAQAHATMMAAFEVGYATVNQWTLTPRRKCVSEEGFWFPCELLVVITGTPKM